MKQNVVLIVMSLLSIILSSIHFSHDIVRGSDSWGRQSLIGVLILVVWLYGTLVLAERRSGRVIMLVGGLLAAAMPVIHARVNLESIAAFFFIWTLFAMGATGTLSVILAVRALRSGTMTAVANENPDR
jgi:hypothetical protein